MTRHMRDLKVYFSLLLFLMTFSTSREVEMVSPYCFSFMYFVERMNGLSTKTYDFKTLQFIYSFSHH